MKNLLILAILAAPLIGFAQSKTTQAFHKQYDEAFVLFFYQNTLQMLNQDDNPEFGELIKDIEKMKFVRVDIKANDFEKDDFNKLVSKYHDEKFEDLLTMRHEGMNVNAYIQESKGITTGIVMLMQDDESISILDVKGAVPINKLMSLISKVKALDN